MTQSETVEKFKNLYDRAAACGLVLKLNGEYFEFNIGHANGLISYRNLEEVETFIRGYELGYESSLNQ